MNERNFLIILVSYFIFTNCLFSIDKLFEFEVNIFNKHILHEIKEFLVFNKVGVSISKETKKNGDIVFSFWDKSGNHCDVPRELTLSKIEIKKIICFDDANMFLCYLPLITIEFDKPQRISFFILDKTKRKKGIKFEKDAYYAIFVYPYDHVTGNRLGIGKKHFKNVDNGKKFCFY